MNWKYLGVPLGALALVTAGCGDPSTVGGFEPVDAVVAVQVEGEDVARVGDRQLPAGTEFDLVVAVRARRGDDEVYFTEAEALEVDGRRLEAEELRRWPEQRRARVRWFTIEGTPPFIDWSERGRLPRYEPAFRPEWGAGWTVPGDVRPRNDNLAYGVDRLGSASFGTARYHARVEVYASGNNLTPIGRYPSPAVADDGATVDPAASSVTAVLPSPLQTASSVYGLPQVEGLPSDGELEARFKRMAGAGLLFSRNRVLRGVLAEAGRDWESIDWTPLDLAAPEAEAAVWGDGVLAGDVLRVGSRVVFAFRDALEAPAEPEEPEEPDSDAAIEIKPGVVDYSDLCLDYSRGAAVRRLGDVFAGGGEVQWGRIAER